MASKRVGSRYLLRRPIGQGGICTVYEAVHLFTARRVALKLLNPEYAQHDEARLRLLDEARALGMVRHPNVVEIHDAGTWDNTPYVVMELLEGRNLEGLLTSRGRFAPSDAANVARQVCLGLAATHAAGIVHRDVKPANVLVVRAPMQREQATIIDFGVARLPRGTDRTSQRLGTADGLVGTPEYMAPEVISGMPIDHRADLYGVGVMMWECLTESVPVPGDLGEVMRWHAAGGRLSLRSARPDVPPALAEIVERCLARDPRERFPDASALVHAIDASGVLRGAMRLLEYGTREGDAAARAAAGMTTAVGYGPSGRVLTPAFGSPAAAAQDDRRSSARAPFNGPVRVTAGTEVVDLRAEDISENGLLCIGPSGFVVGEVVQLRFALPSGDVVATQASVRWVRDRSGSSRAPCAIAFQFNSPSTALRSAIAGYIAIMSRD